jgi:hypothetical protein
VTDLYDTDKTAEAGRRLPREIVLEYMWREDITLNDNLFGVLKGRTVPLLCGGTIVFDGRGNILYFVNKPGLEHPDDLEEGRERKKQLLDHLEQLVRNGWIGLMDEITALGMGIQKFAIEGRQVNGEFRLEITPHFRHMGDGSR